MRHRVGLRFSFAGSALLNRYGKLLERLTLTPGRVLALSYIHEHPGCDQRSLAANLSINEASAMSVINRLEADGFAQRREGRDKRTKALFTTERGEQAFAEALAIETKLTTHLFGWMAPEELAKFMAAVDEVCARAVGAPCTEQDGDDRRED
jgi:DNA-binding MarR family transcriptional regulator